MIFHHVTIPIFSNPLKNLKPYTNVTHRYQISRVSTFRDNETKPRQEITSQSERALNYSSTGLIIISYYRDRR